MGNQLPWKRNASFQDGVSFSETSQEQSLQASETRFTEIPSYSEAKWCSGDVVGPPGSSTFDDEPSASCHTQDNSPCGGNGADANCTIFDAACRRDACGSSGSFPSAGGGSDGGLVHQLYEPWRALELEKGLLRVFVAFRGVLAFSCRLDNG